jgi:hypothetical protein
MKNNEKGQAIILVVTALGIVLIGAMGLAIDGAQIYAHREMAQAAADAAAEAAVMSIFAGTTSFVWTSAGAGYNCKSTDTFTPCVYARNNGFGLTGSSDTVSVAFPASPYNGVTGSPNFTYPFVQVTITRTLQTGFMQLLGTATSTVKSIGGAGIMQTSSPVPILVLYSVDNKVTPLTLGGSSSITIKGGAGRAIQVNSSFGTTVSGGGNIDLSAAGPLGTGADFGNGGLPTSNPGINLGTTGHYVQPAAPIQDPFRNLAEPGKPAAAAATAPIAVGVDGCPAGSGGCTLYSPGDYPTGISISGGTTAVFKPGVYYTDSNGFSASHANVISCVGCPNDPDTGSGMMVYLTGGGTLSWGNGNNTSANLIGSDTNSTYKGILFFAHHYTSGGSLSHDLGSGASVILTGTFYFTNGTNTSSKNFQTASGGGHSCSGTFNTGEIIADAVSLSGSSCIGMTLNPAYKIPIDQIALVH